MSQLIDVEGKGLIVDWNTQKFLKLFFFPNLFNHNDLVLICLGKCLKYSWLFVLDLQLTTS